MATRQNTIDGEIAAEMVMRIIDGRAQKPLHSIPGGHDLPE